MTPATHTSYTQKYQPQQVRQCGLEDKFAVCAHQEDATLVIGGGDSRLYEGQVCVYVCVCLYAALSFGPHRPRKTCTFTYISTYIIPSIS